MSKIDEIKNEIEAINEEFGLLAENGTVITTSLKVAEVYGKEHKDVLKKIRGFIDLIPELNERNFSLVEYKDSKGENRPMYEMDRQGFSMLVNKYNGEEATIFTYKYTKAFERMIELIQQLEEENEKLYSIAVSDDSQMERQYEADKVKYSIRNIGKVLAKTDYKNLEETIDKIIDVHMHLKPSDRDYNHSSKNKTEYKKHIIGLIDKRLDEILLRNSDMLYHGVAVELQKMLKDNKLATTNRSTAQIIANREKKIEELKNDTE